MTTPRDDIAGLIGRKMKEAVARVKEWEEHAGPYWEARALRAEQERDEAIEAINAIRETYLHAKGRRLPIIQEIEEIAIRRLASGPEKEKI